VGAAGLLMLRGSFPLLGLSLLAAYAALGFDGLGHYAVAPIELHSFGANATIIFEVVVAALLLSATLYVMGTRFRRRPLVEHGRRRRACGFERLIINSDPD